MPGVHFTHELYRILGVKSVWGWEACISSRLLSHPSSPPLPPGVVLVLFTIVPGRLAHLLHPCLAWSSFSHFSHRHVQAVPHCVHPGRRLQ